MTIGIQPAQHWRAVAADQCARRDALIPSSWRLPASAVMPPEEGGLLDVTGAPGSCGILSHTEIIITKTEATQLVRQMLTGDLTSVEVTTAFCKRAAIAQQLVSRM